MLGIFLDIETTGLDPFKHSVVDIALKIIELPTQTLLATYQSLVKHPVDIWEKRDLISMQINGYTWEHISQGQEIAKVSCEIKELFNSVEIQRGKAVFICQNPGFDRAFFSQIVDVYAQEKMNWPYHWLDLASMYWTISHLKRVEKREPFPVSMNLSKNAIAKQYFLPPEQEPHHALNGVDHLIQCYQAVLNL